MTVENDTSYLEGRKELCNEYGVNFDEVKAIHLKLVPLIKNIVEKEKIAKKLNESYENVDRNLKYWKEIWDLSTSNVTPKQKSLLELFLYLELSEGVFDELVQVIAYILMENHHDLYDPHHLKFLKDQKELDKLDFYFKLQFLEKHDFEFVVKAFDRDLRNAIAHLDFLIKEDGNIVSRKSGQKIGNVTDKNNYLGTLCAMIIVIINKVLIGDPAIIIEHKKKC
jgi:hypothetical protein